MEIKKSVLAPAIMAITMGAVSPQATATMKEEEMDLDLYEHHCICKIYNGNFTRQDLNEMATIVKSHKISDQKEIMIEETTNTLQECFKQKTFLCFDHIAKNCINFVNLVQEEILKIDSNSQFFIKRLLKMIVRKYMY